MLKIENEIWEKIRDRDSSAFESLYDRFSGAMFSLSLEILGDRWEAEEVIQDIFSVLWKNRKPILPKKVSSVAGSLSSQGIAVLINTDQEKED